MKKDINEIESNSHLRMAMVKNNEICKTLNQVNKIHKEKKWKVDLYKGGMIYIATMYSMYIVLAAVPSIPYIEFFISALFIFFGILLCYWTRYFPFLELIEIYLLIIINNLIPYYLSGDLAGFYFGFFSISRKILYTGVATFLTSIFFKKFGKERFLQKTQLDFQFMHLSKIKRFFLNSSSIGVFLNILLICFTPSMMVNNENALLVPLFFFVGLILGSVTGRNCYYWICITIISQVYFPYMTIEFAISNTFSSIYMFLGYFVVMLCGSNTGKKYLFTHLMKNFINIKGE